MAGRTLIAVIAVTALALVLGIFWPAMVSMPPAPDAQKLPWNIKQVGETTEVFGLRLGESTMEEGLDSLQADAEVSLFVSEEDQYAVEAYFNDVQLMGLGAKVVLTADLDEQSLREMYSRGERISTLGSGTRKVSLTEQDLLQVRRAPIASITYLPKIQLQPEQIEKRFGTPAQRIKEMESGAVHWLYPAFGLDVTLSENEKDVLQYLPPNQFDNKLLQPLLGRGALVSD